MFVLSPRQFIDKTSLLILIGRLFACLSVCLSVCLSFYFVFFTFSTAAVHEKIKMYVCSDIDGWLQEGISTGVPVQIPKCHSISTIAGYHVKRHLS